MSKFTWDEFEGTQVAKRRVDRSRRKRVMAMRRPGPVFYGLVSVFLSSGVALYFDPRFMNMTMVFFVFVLSGAVLSVAFHEYAHAFVAFKGGDHSVEEKGYLTLDPRKYTHPLLSIGIPILFIIMGGIGLPGGAVYIEHYRLRSKWIDSAVSLAGPAATFASALLFMLPLSLGLVSVESHEFLAAGLAFLALVEVSGTILNLLPIPGLDGFGALYPHLRGQAREIADQIRPYGPLMFLLLFPLSPSLMGAFWDACAWLLDQGGVDHNLAAVGYDIFKFWD